MYNSAMITLLYTRIIVIVYLIILITSGISSIDPHAFKTRRGILFPRDSESRQTKSLDGMWDFKADTSAYQNQGFENMWYDQPLYKV